MEGLPNFPLLFDQIGHYLSDPSHASPNDLKVAQDAYDSLVKTIYRATGHLKANECSHDHTIHRTL